LNTFISDYTNKHEVRIEVISMNQAIHDIID